MESLTGGSRSWISHDELSSGVADHPFSPNLETMSSVLEIESAVKQLSRAELHAFRDWFLGFDAAEWDRQFEEDVNARCLDALADEALKDLREGRCKEL